MAGEIVLYQSEDGKIRLETRLENESLWLTQPQIAELFHTTVPNISMHIKNVFDEGELQLEATVQDFLTVRQEGERQVQRKITHYNLDVVISVGYRVKSLIATRFRIWATQQLKEYIVKGFVMAVYYVVLVYSRPTSSIPLRCIAATLGALVLGCCFRSVGNDASVSAAYRGGCVLGGVGEFMALVR